MTPPESWSSAKAWREFFDTLSDAVLVLDTRARVVFANTAALRLVPCDAGTPLQQLQGTLGAAAVRWLVRAASSQPDATPPPLIGLADGRVATFAWRRLDARHCALRLHPDPGPQPALRPALPQASDSAAMRETIRLFWDSPFPVT